MINQKARSIVDLKNITYGYGGCPISIQDNNINIYNNIINYFYNTNSNTNSNINTINKDKFIKEYFSVFYK